MAPLTPSLYATQLRHELTARNRAYAHGRAHVESYGSAPVIVYEPDGSRHGNFFDAAYAEIATHPEWERRFDKVHAQAARALPKPQLDPARRWRELDSSMSSDALLMNVFCTPGVADSAALRNALGVEGDAVPIFGWKARVPLANGRFDRTEIDMRFGSLLVEAKLTEMGFQSRAAAIVEAYRDFDAVFDRDRLPRIEIPTSRWMRASEFPENDSQEFESIVADPALFSTIETSFRPPRHLRNSDKERDKLQHNAHTLKVLMCAAGLSVMPSPSHIVPLLVGDAARCKAVSDALLRNHGIYAQPINYPTVPRGTERLRFTPSPAHTEAMMAELISALDHVWATYALDRAA